MNEKNCKAVHVTETAITIVCPTDELASKITNYVHKHLPTWNFQTEYDYDRDYETQDVYIKMWRQKPQTGMQVEDILYVQGLITGKPYSGLKP